MNAIDRLGLTLLHFLWQGAIIAALYTIARGAGHRFLWPAHRRYTLACAALALMALAPLLTFVSLPTPASTDLAFAAPLSDAHPFAARGPAEILTIAFDRPLPTSYFPWMVAVWLAGAVFCWLRLLAGCIVAQRLRSHLVHPAPAEWRHTLDTLRRRIALTAPVRLLVSARIPAPAAIGWLRPVILVPAAALAGLSTAQLEALLLHELAHIRRHDYLINILQSVIEALLFYHPAVWWISHHIRTERELCCDDAAVSLSGDATGYARALAHLALLPPAPLGTAAAATAGPLAHRIARLLGHSPAAPVSFTAPAVSAITVAALTAAAVFAQSAPRPKFEAAVVKPSQTQNMQRVRPTPGRLSADSSVHLLIQNAYGLQGYQIVGLPDSLDTRYSVEATAGANVSRDEMFQMLQSLLEERFQLKYHRESRELPVWALTPARSGIKLPAPKDGNCTQPSPNAPADWSGGRMAPPGGPSAPPPQCGSIRIALQPTGARMQGGGILMPELIRTLAMALGRPVLDRTAYTRPFDLQLDFLPDEVTTAMPPPPPGSDIRDRSNNPTITVALQEQLGLRLESTKGPVEVMVIDHIERPPAN